MKNDAFGDDIWSEVGKHRNAVNEVYLVTEIHCLEM